MIENRNIKRWHLIYYLHVYNQDDESLLGHIVNISVQGMKVVGPKYIPPETDFSLWLEIPMKDGKKGKITLIAKSLWCKKDANPDFYNTGFILKDPDPITLQNIQDLIDTLKYEE